MKYLIFLMFFVFISCNFAKQDDFLTDSFESVKEGQEINFNALGCSHFFDSAKSAWSPCEYYGEIDGCKYHRSRCEICGFEVKYQCYPSFACRDCGPSAGKSSDININVEEIKEDIKTLVIVSNKGFEKSPILEKYKNYKQEKSNLTVQEKYYETGVNPETIRNDLKKIYKQCKDIAVLILGRGTNCNPYSIPEFVNKNHPNLAGKRNPVATDFYYGYLKEDGHTNLYPDVPVGRISASNLQELEAQLEKIMKMENGDKYLPDNIVLVQHKKNDGRTYFDDEPKEIREYLSTKPTQKEYCIKDVFTLDSDNVNTAIQNSFLVSYSGHGGTNFWGDSRYDITKVRSLKSNCYPIVLGVTCNSANYTAGDECLAEAFMRNKDGGAVAYIGASSSMIAYYSKAATVGTEEMPGMIRSLFNEDINKRPKTLGGLFHKGLRSIKARTYYSKEYKDYSIEVLNLFGDPTMKLDYIYKN